MELFSAIFCPHTQGVYSKATIFESPLENGHTIVPYWSWWSGCSGWLKVSQQQQEKEQHFVKLEQRGW